MSQGEILLQAKDLSVTKGQNKILDIPSLNIIKGQIVAVTGPNGAGKSTLLKTLAHLEPGFGGELWYRQKQALTNKQVLAVRRQIAMVFQDPLLLKGRVYDNVEMGLKIRGMERKARKELVSQWLERLCIGQLAERDVRSLSGGEAQRVNLARSFVMGPEVIFLDEPFTYLDIPTKASLVRELKQILTETETTALIITHELMDIPYLADRMLVMMQGQIVQEGAVADVLARPVSRKVAGFLGVENVWPLQGERFVVADQPEDIPEEGESWACIRPENILLCGKAERSAEGKAEGVTDGVSDGVTDGGNVPNILSGEVTDVQPYGYYYRIQLAAEALELTLMVSTVHFTVAPTEGEILTVQLPPEKIHVIWE